MIVIYTVAIGVVRSHRRRICLNAVIQMLGNVGNVKEVRDVGDDCVLNFSIAVDNGKDKNGERPRIDVATVRRG